MIREKLWRRNAAERISDVSDVEVGLSQGAEACVKGLPALAVYVVNKLSARFHAAVILECGAVRRACAPSEDIDDWH